MYIIKKIIRKINIISYMLKILFKFNANYNNFYSNF